MSAGLRTRKEKKRRSFPPCEWASEAARLSDLSGTVGRRRRSGYLNTYDRFPRRFIPGAHRIGTFFHQGGSTKRRVLILLYDCSRNDMRFGMPASARPRMSVLAAALLALIVCGAAGAQPIELTLSPYANSDLRTVVVTVNGHESPFIFDTGAGDTVLTPEETRYAGCIPFVQVTGFRATGGLVTSSRCGPVMLQIGGYRVDREVVEFDLLKLLRKAPPVGGILGLASFEGQAVTLDLAHDRVTIETRASLARRIRSMRPINVRITVDASGAVVPFIEARAKTGTLWLEVDSGNDGPVFLAP